MLHLIQCTVPYGGTLGGIQSFGIQVLAFGIFDVIVNLRGR